MSQLDISIFYSHLFGLLLTFYIFSHFIVIILINFYYNMKLRGLEIEEGIIEKVSSNNTEIITRILE